jgi:hypothetical protein
MHAGIIGLHSAQDMTHFPRLSVFCCRLEVEALRRINPPTMESY